jgi:hypothetical protein
MRIAEVRERVDTISSNIANAYIDFSKMTCSVVAVTTDVIRDGRPVIGYGYHSNGRHDASGILRARILPRLAAADPDSLVDDAGTNLDPFSIRDVTMKNEKPGQRGERSVATGAVDMAVGTRSPRSRTFRCGSCWPTATGAASPMRRCGSTPPAATTTPARTTARCRTRCAAISIAAIGW